LIGCCQSVRQWLSVLSLRTVVRAKRNCEPCYHWVLVSETARCSWCRLIHVCAPARAREVCAERGRPRSAGAEEAHRAGRGEFWGLQGPSVASAAGSPRGACTWAASAEPGRKRAAAEGGASAASASEEGGCEAATHSDDTLARSICASTLGFTAASSPSAGGGLRLRAVKAKQPRLASSSRSTSAATASSAVS
jgi:hypothetical protein